MPHPYSSDRRIEALVLDGKRLPSISIELDGCRIGAYSLASMLEYSGACAMIRKVELRSIN